MSASLARLEAPSAKSGRPVPQAIALVEAVCEEIARDENRGTRLRRTIEFLSHIRRIGGQLESDLVAIVRSIYGDSVPDLREAATLAESLYALKRERS